MPRRTLRRHRNGEVRSPGKVVLGRFKPDLERLEQLLTAVGLVAYLKEIDRVFFGLSAKDVGRLSYELAAKEGIAHIFSCEKKMAGLAWLQSFMEHPDLSIRKPQATSVNRCVGFNRADVSRLFKIYKELVDKGGMTADRIWNAKQA